MKKTILGSVAATALMSGIAFAAPCDPCSDASVCEPCGNVSSRCDCGDDDATCNPYGNGCSTDANGCGTTSSKLKVYTDVAMLVGNVDGGWGLASGIGYTLASGVKATVGFQRGQRAFELGYTGLYNNLSTSLTPLTTNPNFPRLFANYNALDANFVKTLDRNPNLKVFVGVGYANFTQTARFVNWDDSYANDMVGFHVGGKWSRSVRRAGIEAYGKLGVYANTVTNNWTPAGSFAYGNCRGAFVAAGGVNLTYKLTQRLTGYIGYDVTKIEGVERGQFAGAWVRPLADDGVLIQGVAFGVKAAF